MKLHPITVLSYSIILFLLIIYYDNPLFLISLTLLIIINISVLGEAKKLLSTLKIMLPLALIIVIINPLIYQGGATILFSFSLPYFGEIRIALEAIMYGVMMGIKLISIMMIFTLYSELISRDEAFSFYSKYLNKMTLTSSMTINIMHRLRLEVASVKDVMMLRGVDFKQKNPIKKIKVYYPILKVILLSSLEGSLDRAETLYSKGYGRNKRSSYSKLYQKLIDRLIVILSLLILVIFIYGIVNNFGTYNYYPKLASFKLNDILFYVYLIIPLFIINILLWRNKKWRFLK